MIFSTVILTAMNTRYVPIITATTAKKNTVNAFIGFCTVCAV